MNMKPLILTTAMISAGLTFSTAQAADTGTMPVKITIQNACDITVQPTTLEFGTHGLLLAAIDSTSIMTVVCTKDAPYKIGLDDGEHSLVAGTRRMEESGEFVEYNLYWEAAHTNVWGNTPLDTLDREGTGEAEVITVYGLVPAQNTPSAGTYNDIVQVAVTY